MTTKRKKAARPAKRASEELQALRKKASIGDAIAWVECVISECDSFVKFRRAGWEENIPSSRPDDPEGLAERFNAFRMAADQFRWVCWLFDRICMEVTSPKTIKAILELDIDQITDRDILEVRSMAVDVLGLLRLEDDGSPYLLAKDPAFEAVHLGGEQLRQAAHRREIRSKKVNGKDNAYSLPDAQRRWSYKFFRDSA